MDAVELEQWELDKIYKQLYHAAVHKNQKPQTTKAKVRQKLVQELAGALTVAKLSDILLLSKVKPSKAVYSQVTKLALKRPDVLAQLTQVVQTEFHQQAAPCDQYQQSRHDNSNDQASMEDLRQAEGGETLESNLSQEDAVMLMSPVNDCHNGPFTLTQMPDDELEKHYRGLGG